jgi:hypothetical protein
VEEAEEGKGTIEGTERGDYLPIRIQRIAEEGIKNPALCGI